MKKVLTAIFANLAIFSLSAQTYNMGNLGTISTCSGNFYDSGGSGGAYGNNQSFTATFCSANGQPLWFQFSTFQTEQNYDFLRVYNGPTTASPQIGNYNGTNGPSVIVSSNASNCLTFVFTTDGSVTGAGWAASIGCGTPPAPPPPASGTSCAVAQPFCSGTNYNFPAATGTTAEVGPNYGCLFTQPNPVWYYIQIDSPAGNLNMVLSNSGNRDVDFAAWGPFTSPNGICGNLTANNIVDCSYSTAATEYIDIPNTTTGQFYMLCITNYSNQPTNFTLNTGASSQATTNCAILCNITNMSVTPTPCDVTNNFYSDTVRINVQFPPTTGYLVLTTSLGETDTIYPPYQNTIVAVFDSLVSDGSMVTLRARFSEDTSCTFVRTYLAPQCGCSATVTNNGPICSGDSLVVTLDPNFASSNLALTYNWSGPNGYTYTATGNDTVIRVPNAQTLLTGLYTVTVSDTLCTATSSVNIVVNPRPTNTITSTNIQCFGANNGTATSNAVPSAGATYLWSNGATTATINGLSPGIYRLTVTAQGGCTVSDSVIITQPPSAFRIDSGQVTNIGCGGGNNGGIVSFVSGGVSPYNYNWTLLSNGQTYTGQSISNIQPGSYRLVASDQNGCSDSATYTVTSPSTLTITSTPQQNIPCFGGNTGSAAINISGGSAPITYSWTNSNSTTNIASNLTVGTYSVVVTDSAGCTATATYNITQPTQVTVSLVSQTNLTCRNSNDGTITVAAAGGTTNPIGNYTYNWSNNQTGSTINSLGVGNYSVVVLDSALCSATADYTITAPNAVGIDSVRITNVTCNGQNNGAFDAFASGGTGTVNYTWVRLSDNQVFNGQNISSLAPGYYTLTVRDNNNCFDTATYEVTEPALLTLTQQQQDILCNGAATGSASVNVQGGTLPYQYNWNSTGYAAAPSVSSQSAGQYDVVVRDANACTITATFMLTEPPLLVINLLTQNNLSCYNSNDGSLTVEAVGGFVTPANPYTFNWSNNQSGASIAGLRANTYSVTVTDANACQASASYTLTEPTQLVANPRVTDVTCKLGTNGAIDANPSGGISGYTFMWSNQQTTQINSQLSAGTYRCTVTDATNCSTSFTATVAEPTELVISASSIIISCPGINDGTVTVVASGATPPYSYSISQGTTNLAGNYDGSFVGLAAGDYTAIVSDLNNCTKSVSVNVPTPDPDVFSTTTDSTSCYGSAYNDGGAFIIATSIQNGPYRFGIDGGAPQFSGDFYNLSAGSHIITAINGRGCSTNVPVIVLEPLPIVVDVTPDTLILPLGNSGSVNTVYLNASNVSYNWDPANGLSCEDCPNPTVTVYQPTNYTVTVSMINGTATCYGSATLFVDVLPEDPVYIPNAITPNGDGNNDVFFVYGRDIKTVNLQIFNRWGEKVFDSNNQWLGWDGTYKGQPQNTGVFTYKADITFLNEKQKQRVGSLTLIR